MPLVSQAQRAWMHANHPEMAKRWEAETPAGPLPERVGKRTGKSKSKPSAPKHRSLAAIARRAKQR